MEERSPTLGSALLASDARHLHDDIGRAALALLVSDVRADGYAEQRFPFLVCALAAEPHEFRSLRLKVSLRDAFSFHRPGVCPTGMLAVKKIPLDCPMGTLADYCPMGTQES